MLKLMNCRHPRNNPDGVKPLRVWRSPDGQYAVAEVFYGEYFAAGAVTEYDAQTGEMTLVCTDEFSTETDEVDFHGYRVDWSTMEYGFCKLVSSSLERIETRTYRIYFDPELYKRRYEELHGEPYSGNKKFHR